MLGGAEQKSRAQKITEARRVGAPRHIASRAERGELTRFFEMRSNLFKNVHKLKKKLDNSGGFYSRKIKSFFVWKF